MVPCSKSPNLKTVGNVFHSLCLENSGGAKFTNLRERHTIALARHILGKEKSTLPQKKRPETPKPYSPEMARAPHAIHLKTPRKAPKKFARSILATAAPKIPAAPRILRSPAFESSRLPLLLLSRIQALAPDDTTLECLHCQPAPAFTSCPAHPRPGGPPRAGLGIPHPARDYALGFPGFPAGPLNEKSWLRVWMKAGGWMNNESPD